MAFYSGPRRPSGNPGRGREYVFNRGNNRWEVMDSATGRTIGPVSQTGQLLDDQGNVRRTTAPAPTVRVDENLNVRVPPAPAPQQTVTQPSPQPAPTPEPPQTPVEAPAAAPEPPADVEEPYVPQMVNVTLPEPDPIPEPAAAPAAPPGPTTEERESARDIIRGWLQTYDLESLEDTLYDLVFNQNILDENRIKFTLRQTEEYKTRFAGNEQRRAAGLNVYSEEYYLELENQYRRYRSLAGMPEGFYDSTADIATFIGNDVSPDEFYSRLQEGYNAVADADPEVVAELRRLYNIGESDLAQFFLDPERSRTRLLAQARSARIAGEAIQTGMELTVEQAEMLERQGITSEAAQQGFGAISQLGELFRTNIDEQALGEQAFGQEEQIGAIFGTSAAAQQRIRQRTRRRQAQFEAGGRFATQDGEIVGLR